MTRDAQCWVDLGWLRRGQQSQAVPPRWAVNDATLLAFAFALLAAHTHCAARPDHRMSTALDHLGADCLAGAGLQMVAGAALAQAHHSQQAHRNADQRACRAGWTVAATGDLAPATRDCCMTVLATLLRSPAHQTPVMCSRHTCFDRATAGDGRARSLVGLQMAGRGAERAVACCDRRPAARLWEVKFVTAVSARVHLRHRRR